MPNFDFVHRGAGSGRWAFPRGLLFIGLLLCQNPSALASDPVSEPVPIPSPSPRALEYHRTGNALWLLGRAIDLSLPALFLATGLSARLSRKTRHLGRGYIRGLMLFASAYVLIRFLVEFPLSCHIGFFRAHAYGLSNQSFIRWLTHQLKALAVELMLFTFLIPIPYLLLKRFGTRAWMIIALLHVPVAVFLVFLTPLVYDPLFNQFGRMQDRELESRILQLASRSGISADRVYEVDKSRDTHAINAYVTGIGNSRRIVLWDTLLARLEPDEVLTVMAHEMGHYVLNHVWIGLCLACTALAGGLYLTDQIARWIIACGQTRLGFSRLEDPASLPLILLMVSALELTAAPVSMALARHMEAEADRFAAELVQNPRAGASTFAKLLDANLGVPWPSPLYSTLRATHPSAGDRISFFNSYRPWAAGNPLRYAHLFAPAPSH